MSTNSTMINDRYCWNCGLAEHDCDSQLKNDFRGYCINWTPTDSDFDNIEDFQLEENESICVSSITSDEPENCTKQYNEDICEECEFRKYEMVGHTGGSSFHSTKKYWCDWGHWKDDF